MILLRHFYLVVCALLFDFQFVDSVYAETPAAVKVGGAVNEWTQAAVIVTTKPFDLAIQGRGFFVLQKENGNHVYSRFGEMKLDQSGFLTHTSSGHRVMGYCQGRLEPIDLTQYSDANSSGESALKSFRIELNGEIVGIYENGKTHANCTLALALFGDSSHLKRIYPHVLSANQFSGEAFVDKPQTEGRGVIYSSSLEDLDAHMYGINLKYSEVDRLVFEKNKMKMAFEQWNQQKTLFYVYDAKLSRDEFDRLAEIARVAGDKIQKINAKYAMDDARYASSITAITDEENDKALKLLGEKRFKLINSFRKSFNEQIYVNFGVDAHFTGF